MARLASGVTQIDTISREEIDKNRAVSKAKDGPWFAWFEEMVKKSAVKRASKMWPRTERLAAAEEVINLHQGNETQLGPLTIDANGEVVDAARSAFEASQERKERLVSAANAATSAAKLREVWITGLKEVRDSNDEEAYAAFKAAVQDRGEALKKPAEEPVE